MYWKSCCHVIGNYLYFLAAFLGFGLLVSAYFQFVVPPHLHPAPHTTLGFLYSTIVCLFFAALLRWYTKHDEKVVQLREAILSVVLIWLITSVLCALPFTLSGTLQHFVDAWFESVSGLTTTGSSICQAKAYNAAGKEIPIQFVATAMPPVTYTFYGTITPVRDKEGTVLYTGVEALPLALIFWRSALHWYGGLGIVLLFVAILPALGTQARTLFRYESTGPLFTPLFPKVRDTAIVLLKIYVFLTIACIAALMIVNPELSLFESTNIAFSTISTGGFSPKNSSIAYYQSPGTELVIIVFMLAGGVNFAIYYDVMKGRFYRMFDPELLTFIGIIFVLGLLTSIPLIGTKQASLLSQTTSGTYGFWEALRYGYFQIVSCNTNTGFATADFDKWPALSQSLMLFAMYLGGMAGSTSGGIKTVRTIILALCARNAIAGFFRRNEVRISRIGTREIDTETLSGVLNFFLLMVLTSLVGLLCLVAMHIDWDTAIGLNGCMISNTGSSFRAAGPAESCAFLPALGKVVCILWMLIGRLEYYAWLTLLLPSFWRSR